MELTITKKLLAVALTAAFVAGCSSSKDENAGASSADSSSLGAGAEGGAGGASGQANSVYFDLDKSEIRADAAAVLDAQAAGLANGSSAVRLEGNCDERGTTEYNMALGERRAKAAKDYLVLKGVSAERIETVSFGEEKPVCSEQSEDCFQQNRRVDVK